MVAGVLRVEELFYRLEQGQHLHHTVVLRITAMHR